MSIVDIVGFVSNLVGIIQFGESLFPSQETKGSNVRMTVGLDSAGGLKNAGGTIPGVALFNEVGGFLGQSQDNGKVQDGTTAELLVEQASGQQATYGLFQAGKDAVCVAYVSITWPDNSQYAMPGDWGMACGGSWYYSNIYIDNSNYKPRCMWIDSNGDQPSTGFQVHFPEFRSNDDKVPTGKTVDYLCNSKAPFQLFTGANPQTIDYWNTDGKTTSQASISSSSKRSETKSRRTTPLGRRQAASAQLVVTNSTDHSAKELCDSKTSSGPDLYNQAESQFCRMSDKTVFPACDAKTTDNCFNADSKALVVGGKSTRETYGLIWDWTVAGTTTTTNLATREAKPYDTVLEWGLDGTTTSLTSSAAAAAASSS